MKPRLLVTLVLLCPVWMAQAGAPPPSAQAQAGTWRPTAQAFARVSVGREAVLSLPFAAQVIALHVQPGAQVAAGDELARVDAPLLRQHLATWEQSLRELALARKRLSALNQAERDQAVTRRERLTGEQQLSRSEGQSRLAWDALAADLDYLHTQADAASLARRIDKQGLQVVAQSLGDLRAPFAGVVAGRPAVLGQQLAAGEPLLEIESLDQAYLDVGVAQAELPRWRGGETRWRSPAGSVALTALQSAPRYDAASGLWLLRFQASAAALASRDGAWVRVEHLGAPEAVLWVPASAVVARNGKTWCVRQRGERFEPVEVGVGTRQHGRIPVISGLRAGDRVVTEGAYELLYRDIKDLIRFED